MKFFIFFFLLSFHLTTLLSADNLIQDGSFELGNSDWRTIRFSKQGKFFRAPHVDRSDFIHGKQSLFIENPDADTIELTGKEVFLKGGKPYIFSWYAKSSRPLLLRTALISENAKKQWFVLVKYAMITSEWKRIEYTILPKEDGAYLPRFTWGNWNGKANDASIHFDAVQLEEGSKAADFKPRNQVEVSMEMNSRISVEMAPLNVTVRAVNHTGEKAEMPLSFSVIDTVFSSITQEIPIKFEIAPHSAVEHSFQIKPEKYGHWGIREKNGTCQPLFFAVVPEPVKGPIHPGKTRMTGLEYYFACSAHRQTKLDHVYELAGVNVEDNLIFFRNSGISLLRVGNHGTAFTWKFIETAPGEFNWKEIDMQTALARKYGLNLMAVIGNMFYLRDRDGKKRLWSRLPKFVISNAELYKSPRNRMWDGVLPNHADWIRYVSEFAKHNKGAIAAYEITNEPNIVIPAENYVEYVKLAAREIKEADPGALVIGGCLTADYDGKLGHYLDLLNSSGALAMCDALSFHPYTSRLDSSSYTAESNIRMLKKKTGNKTLWNSELYYLWDPPKEFYNKESVLFAGMKPHHLFRRFCIDFGEGLMLSIPLSKDHILMADGETKWEGSPTFLPTILVPNAMYAAYASASALFTGCVPEGKIKTPVDATAYHFQHRNGKFFTVCWQKEGANSVQVLFPKDTEVTDFFGNRVIHSGKLDLNQNPFVIYHPKEKRIDIRFKINDKKF